MNTLLRNDRTSERLMRCLICDSTAGACESAGGDVLQVRQCVDFLLLSNPAGDLLNFRSAGRITCADLSIGDQAACLQALAESVDGARSPGKDILRVSWKLARGKMMRNALHPTFQCLWYELSGIAMRRHSASPEARELWPARLFDAVKSSCLDRARSYRSKPCGPFL